jgi:D-alanyl-lipoteichoic acid acyltransferase DltB (MBOAT superfamily)
MFFNSIDFAVFLPVVFILYWFVFNKNLKHQNLLIAVSSYVFYGWWDWRFLSLILFSTIVDYFIGNKLRIEKKDKKRKLLLFLSISINLGFLGFFKYYNFFLDNFVESFSFFGMSIRASSLNIILPVGISFYTFQTLSYTIDVYKNKLTPTKDFVAFVAFVSFFPQLVAGPIERATNLLQNFAFPYFSRDIAEFWRRWHISLSTWFRDYVYIPLGGSRGNLFSKIRNVADVK